MITTGEHPYELHQQGGGFTVFESAQGVGLPLSTLAMATLQGVGGRMMILDFGAARVVIDGEHLAELFGHFLAGRVKTIRSGRHGDCIVSIIQIVKV